MNSCLPRRGALHSLRDVHWNGFGRIFLNSAYSCCDLSHSTAPYPFRALRSPFRRLCTRFAAAPSAALQEFRDASVVFDVSGIEKPLSLQLFQSGSLDDIFHDQAFSANGVYCLNIFQRQFIHVQLLKFATLGHLVCSSCSLSPVFGPPSPVYLRATNFQLLAFTFPRHHNPALTLNPIDIP